MTKRDRVAYIGFNERSKGAGLAVVLKRDAKRAPFGRRRETHATESAFSTWLDPHLRLLLAGEETEEVINKVSVQVCKLWLEDVPFVRVLNFLDSNHCAPHIRLCRHEHRFLICVSCGIRDERNTRWGSVSLSMDKEGERMEGDGTNLGPKPSNASPNPFPLL